MSNVTDLVRVLSTAVFAYLAIFALLRIERARSRQSAIWIAASFSVMALVTVASLALPARTADSGSLLIWAGKVQIIVLALFPYL